MEYRGPNVVYRKISDLEYDDCFLKILRRSEFQSSDIIGVIHRTMSREKLEEVGNKLSELKQWYRNDTEILEIFESVPYGISINIQEKIH